MNQHPSSGSPQLYDKTGTSKFCHELNINSLTDWKTHFDYVRATSQLVSSLFCLFDMTSENAYDAFDIVLKARTVTQKHEYYSKVSNELLFASWGEDLKNNTN